MKIYYISSQNELKIYLIQKIIFGISNCTTLRYQLMSPVAQDSSSEPSGQSFFPLHFKF
jgi:hypothetical protein